MLDSVFAALAVLALFGSAIWLLRRFGGGALAIAGARGAVRELVERERLTLGPRERLHLVEAGGERLLVASHGGGVTLIARLGERAAAATGAAVAGCGRGSNNRREAALIRTCITAAIAPARHP